ncbi:MAG: hypothetical protein GX127_07170 [Eubacteriaceae bacterium]|jgi:uncharacterized membrane protein YczE|nr:hypothetical protein [Eubacteriaceae bacterium]
MNQYALRIIKMFVGFIFYGLGIVVTLRANIGYAPWEVFHVGVANTVGMSIGMVSILVGVVIFIITVSLGETLGSGAILNMIFIGVFTDLFNMLSFIPEAQNLTMGLVMMVVGLTIISFATYLYISSAFGTGPRDSLMVALSRITGFSAGACRGFIEVSVTVIGYFLGGSVGVGTVLSALVVGFILQGVFKIFQFEPKNVQHEDMKETFNRLKGYKESFKRQ